MVVISDVSYASPFCSAFPALASRVFSSKAAANHFIRSLAHEHPSITATSFRPGIVETEMITNLRGEVEENMRPSTAELFLRPQISFTPDVVGERLVRIFFKGPKSWSGKFVDVFDQDFQEFLNDPETEVTKPV